MIVLIPILVILAGVALLLQRRYFAQRDEHNPHVIVKGHTYSEVVESKPTCVVETKKVDDVRRCCIVGAGQVGAITGIVLALKNPNIEFSVVDTNEQLIQAWKSDRTPIPAPGLDDILFDDECLVAIEAPDSNNTTTAITPKTEPQVGRRRRLKNLSFSSDVHTGVATAELIFLSVEMDDTNQSFSYLDRTLRTIAAASKGPKILVQRTTCPYGTVQHIKNQLKFLTPSIPHTILTNPTFALPGCSITESLNPARVVIGHIYSPESRATDLDPLKKLYTSFLPEERIVTMDAYSAELGRMVGKAALAQQVVSLASAGLLSGGCEASSGVVGWMFGVNVNGPGPGPSVCGSGIVEGMGMGMQEVRKEVKCLVEMAKGLGMDEVAEYWGSVLKMQEFMYRRAVGGLVQQLGETALEGKRVAVVGCEEEREISATVLKELRRAGLRVNVVGDGALKEQVEKELGEDVVVVDKIGAACSGCSGMVFLGASGPQAGGWQEITGAMKERKVLNLGYGLDGVEMKQLGFEVL
ncbi:hypothetical protein BJX63DRAFT_434356 [Aspergillus granulosus]|uniref:UDP-glucose/GDP-mannose dehydrogenase N-terminal domain-containing protein n=1 Tax=Aspergillus granulosus TaxID=176169 RepID=A0ABR4H4D3_9EURO